MATYAELIDASGNSPLIDKVRVACVVAAENIRSTGTSTTAEKLWARQIFENPEAGQRQVLWAVLAQNKELALSAIIGATDAQVQTAVDAAVTLFTE